MSPVLALALSLDAHALVVPDDEPTVAAAVAAAAPGEVIEVRPGTWIEGPITVTGSVVLRGLGTRDEVILQPGAGPELFVVQAGGSLVLEGLTLDGAGLHPILATGATLELDDVVCVGGVAPTDDGGCVEAVDTALTIRSSWFDGSSATEFGGHLSVRGGTLHVEDSVFLAGSADIGGAIGLAYADATILRSSFADNVSGAEGGAISAENPMTLTVDASWFQRNEGGFGGGVYARHEDPNLPTGTIRVTGSTFRENTSLLGGGGALSFDDYDAVGSVHVTGGAFFDNVAQQGGAIAMDTALAPIVEGGWFQGNAAGSGGAVYLIGVVGGEVRANIFRDNTATGGGGAVMLVNGAGALVDANLMCNNLAGSLDGYGAGLGLSFAANAGVRNNVLVGNVNQDFGGGIGAHGATGLLVENNDLLDNGANNGGGNVYVTSGDAVLRNNVIAWARANGGVQASPTGIVDSTYNDYWSNVGGNRIDVASSVADLTSIDPQYTTFSPNGLCADDDLRPAAGSPLIDGGDPALTDPDGSVSDIGSLGGTWAYDQTLFEDLDLDGFVGQLDCDDADATAHPDTVWYDDLDFDGHGGAAPTYVGCVAEHWHLQRAADDCDDADAAVWLEETFYDDVDGDGFGDPATGALSCGQPAGTVLDATDCDDADADAFPGQVWYADLDGDGYGDPSAPIAVCDRPLDAVLDASDCDDGDPAVNPATLWFADADGDGLGAGPAIVACDPGAPASLLDGDCDDGDAAVGLPLEQWPDLDGDGFGDGLGASVVDCPLPAHAPDASDCDDGDELVSPAAPERCNGIDDDCSGLVDDDAVDAQPWLPDLDGDGFGDAAAPTLACTAPPDHTDVPGDCDDGAAGVYPGAVEHCDGVDEDCDALVDEDAVDPSTWYPDGDGDGFGDEAGAPAVACDAPLDHGPGGDCDDADAASFPGAEEVCDDRDNDCDALTDEDLPESTWYADVDADGYGDPAATVQACGQPDGYVVDGTDCNDGDPSTYPEAPGLDADCRPIDDTAPTDTDEPDAGDDVGPDGEDKSEGCGCSAAGGAGGSPLVLLLAGLVGISRRLRLGRGPRVSPGKRRGGGRS